MALIQPQRGMCARMLHGDAGLAGQIFPDNDPKWRGASSDIFVKEAVSNNPAHNQRIQKLLPLPACLCPQRTSSTHAQACLPTFRPVWM
jgi:hypothetical protein